MLVGMVPVWGTASDARFDLHGVRVAPPASVLAGSLPFESLATRLSASGVLIVDLETGETLYESNASRPRPMASLTKLMTALLIVEQGDLDEWMKIPEGLDRIEGQKAKLKPGERYRVGDLLTALLVHSANDAATVLALHHSGSEEEFVRAMNARARVLGLRQTSFADPIGLDDPDHQYASPRDLVWLTMYVLKKPDIARRMAIKSTEIQSDSGSVIDLTHTHTMLKKPSAIVAGKTGTTDAAGECLLSVVEHRGRRYAVIFLQSGDRYADLRRTMAVFNS